jgi:uncharacterized integral membrane protein (TIGR00697 family)
MNKHTLMTQPDRRSRLYIILAAFFLTNALVAEFVGSKIFSLEGSLGIAPIELTLFGLKQSFDLTAGVLAWPFVFIITDLINEYFGYQGVRRLSLIAVGMILYAFGFVFLAIRSHPAAFWENNPNLPFNLNAAYAAVFGQSLWIIVASVVAFLVGQIVDVLVFERIKRATAERFLWLRANGSTAVSQLLDSYVVLTIAFHFGPQQWSLAQVAAVGTKNFIYKIGVAILLTPLLYIVHWWIDRYLAENPEP